MVNITCGSLASTTDSGTSGAGLVGSSPLTREATRRYADPVAGLRRQLPAQQPARDGEPVESSGVEQLVDSLERHPDRFADVPKRHMVRVELANQVHRQRCHLALSIAGRFAPGVDLLATLHKVGPVNDHGHDVHVHL